jgi:predicted amidophosphoribosyltransferase
VVPTSSLQAVARCRICDGPAQPGFAHCFCCTVLVGQLGQPLAPVTAVTPYRVGDGVHRLLRGYKDGFSTDQRTRATDGLARRVAGWLHGAGGTRLAARAVGEWDVVVGVPSSRRPGPAPVDRLIRAVPDLAHLHRPLLGRGTQPTGHLIASRRGFSVTAGVEPRQGQNRGRALVVDDTYATGARAQSAVVALRSAGLEVAGVLVVGRVVDPEASPWQAAYWEGVEVERWTIEPAVGGHSGRHHR